MDARFDPSMCESAPYESTEYGGVLVDPESLAGRVLSQLEFTPGNLRRKQGEFHEGEVVYVEAELVGVNSDSVIRGVYIVFDVNPKTKRQQQNYDSPEQFRVLQAVTNEHKIVVHRNGKPYKIPVDTKYPCTHIDIPDEKLLKIGTEEGAIVDRLHYREYLICTKLLAIKLGIEEEYLPYVI